jgi:hypothetical protein
LPAMAAWRRAAEPGMRGRGPVRPAERAASTEAPCSWGTLKAEETEGALGFQARTVKGPCDWQDGHVLGVTSRSPA